jgi:cobalt-precorrin-7 (C5)-methyltransferase
VISIIGMGPGDGRYALSQARAEVKRCTVLAGYPRLLALVEPEGRRLLDLSGEAGKGRSRGLEARLRTLERLSRDERVGILVSGDPGFHSLLGTIRKLHPEWRLQVIPGLSVFQVACARLGLLWQDYELISLHSGDTDRCGAYLNTRPGSGAVILTGGLYSPESTARYILDTNPGMSGRTVYVCWDIGEDAERIDECVISEVRNREGGRLCTIVIPEYVPENVPEKE